MNHLELYYSYTKNPSTLSQPEENLILVVHPPVFVLNVYDSIQTQKTNIIVLFFFIARYYFIVHETISPKKHIYIETNARAPPLKGV